MDMTGWSQLLAQLGQLPQLFAQVTDHSTRITHLEITMATEADTIARLNTVTTNMASNIGTITAKIKALQDAVASGSAGAVSAAMDDLNPSVTQLETLQASLAAMGANPANPVPDPVPPAPAV